MSAVLSQPVTANDLWQMPSNGKRRELVRGEVLETMPPGGQHGAIAVALAVLLRLWAT